MSKVNSLLKGQDNLPAEASRQHIKFKNTQQKITNICNELTVPFSDFHPENTTNSISAYLKSENILDRLLYSEINTYILSLDTNKRANFSVNVDSLLSYALNETNKVKSDCRKVIIKLYDHFQLAIQQIENIQEILSNGITDTKQNLINDIKGIEKEYIAILGIFASIVLTFVGGITFSSSVLQHMHLSSVYRISMVILLIGLVLINVIYALFNFISKIIKNRDESVQKNKSTKSLWVANSILLVLLFLVVISWKNGVVEKRNNSFGENVVSPTPSVVVEETVAPNQEEGLATPEQGKKEDTLNLEE